MIVFVCVLGVFDCLVVSYVLCGCLTVFNSCEIGLRSGDDVCQRLLCYAR